MAYGAVPGGAALNVATDAPPHRKGLVDLLDHGHLLHIPMAGRAVDLGGNMPHVRKMDVVRNLVDPNPRNGLLIRPIIPDLLDFRLLPFVRATDDLVATEACPDRWDSGIDGPLCREMAVLAVDLVHAGVNGMGERDRLDPSGLPVGDRHSRTTGLGLHERR